MRTNKKEIYFSLKYRDGTICGICKESLEIECELLEKYYNDTTTNKRTSININIDHKYPKSKRRNIHWWSDLENLQLTHIECNNKKADNIIN